MFTLRFFDGSEISMEGKYCRFFTFGGQGRLYIDRIENEDIAIKVIPDFTEGAQETPRRLRQIKDSFDSVKKSLSLSYNDRVFKSVIYRGLPIAQGSALPSEFDYPLAKTLYILAFHFINGEPLNQYLEGEKPLSKKRKVVAKQLLDIFIFLRKGGVVHSDLYPDNFIVNNDGELFILDLEGAGLKDSKDKWIWKPRVIGKPQLWPSAPEVETGNSTFESEMWVGVYLLFFVLTGFKPLDFMTKMDQEAMDVLLPLIDWNSICWPPIPLKGQNLPFINSTCTPTQLKNFMKLYFANTTFEKLLFATYVAGYRQPKSRPSPSTLLESLKSILEI